VNTYVRYANELCRLDQEAAIEEDEDEFDPDEELRDYDSLAKELPVFCASGRVYQKLCGRLKKDRVNADGFEAPDDTEIPQLRTHGRKLAELGRKHTNRAFLNEFLQVLQSVNIWAAAPSRLQEQDAEVKKLREEMVQSCLDDLWTVRKALSSGC
jgi:hypothetical protein